MPLEVEVHIPGGITLAVSAQPSWSIRELKQHVEAKKHIAAHVQALCANSRKLCDSELLSEIAHQNGGVLRLTLHRRNADQIHWLKLLESKEGVARLGEAPDFIRADYEMMLVAVSQDPHSLKHANQKLLANCEFMLAAAKRNSEALQWASKALWADSQFVFAAFQCNWRMLNHASDELRSDRDFMLRVVSLNRWALQCASDDLRADKAFLEAALLGGRRDYIMDHVRGDGRHLCRAHDFQKDEEVVTAAVSSRGRALEWAAPELQANRAVVMEAVNNDPMALEWAAPELRSDRGIVLAALEKDQRASKWIAPELLADKIVSSLVNPQKRKSSGQGPSLSRPSSSVCLAHAGVKDIPGARNSRRPRRSASFSSGARSRPWSAS